MSDDRLDIIRKLQRSGATAQAERHCRDLLQTQPDAPDVLCQLGLIVAGDRRLEEALVLLQRAVQLDPTHAEHVARLAGVLVDLGRLEEALRTAAAACALDPNVASAHAFRAIALQRLKRHEESIAAWQEVLRVRPSDANAQAGLARALNSAHRLAQAEQVAGNALKTHPHHIELLCQFANSLLFAGRMEEAIDPLRKILALKPGFADIETNLGMVFLTLGRYAEGWPRFEARFASSRRENVVKAMQYAQPRWAGDDPAGRTLLLHAEQGYGDTLQFVRFLPPLAARGAALAMRVDKRLHPLLQYAFPEVRFWDYGDMPTGFDCWAPLLSLGLLLPVTPEMLPGKLPYLFARPELRARWRDRIGPRQGALRVGLAWGGSVSYGHDRHRSMHLEMLSHIASVPGTELFSLQFGARAEQAELCRTFDITQFGEAIGPFEEMAALASGMDLVISVDTAVAHLAGALGVPCWVMLAKNSDWRWMQGRADSPWYPGTRLFRQQSQDDWSEPILDVADALRIAARNGRAGDNAF